MKFALFFYASLARSVAAMALEPLKFFTIVLENAKYNKVLGDPYFSKLASLGQLLTNFHAAIHPSQGNYFAMISGDHHDIGGITGDMTVTLDVKSIVDLLEEGGRSWTTYQQGYPGNCSKVSKFGSYVRKHNPFISIKVF